MPFKVAVLRETRPGERRSAMVPAVASQLEKLGAQIRLEAGAAEAAEADLVLGVQPPARDIAAAMRPGAILISFIYAQQNAELVETLRQRGVICLAMEMIPRISRAQAMDALSSQAALGGYYAAL